jgi:hypothetical protein
LLRPRRERPYRRAPEQRDEIAALLSGKQRRLEDVKFQDEQNGRRRGEIGPVTVLEIGGKYSLASHALKLTWFDLDKRSVDAALNAAFNAWRA